MVENRLACHSVFKELVIRAVLASVCLLLSHKTPGIHNRRIQSGVYILT